MQRRRVLLAGAAIAPLLAGCSGDSESPNETTSATTAAPTADGQTTSTVSDNETTTNEPTTEATTEPEETDTPEPSGEANLEVGDGSLSVNTEGDIATAIAGAPIDNTGSAATGEVTATATFLDGSGEEIATEENTLVALPGGKRWFAIVLLIGNGAENAGDYGFSVDFEPEPPGFTMEGLTEVSSTSNLVDDEYTVAGEVRNETGGELSELRAVAFCYLDDARQQIIFTLDQSTSGVSDGGTWSYEMSTSGGSTVESYEVRYLYS